MANSQELIQIEQIDKGLNQLNTTISNISASYLKLVKTIADNTVVIKEQAITFDGLAKAQKTTTDNAKQLDSLGKQQVATEQKLKDLEDSRTVTIVKNRLAIQENTKAIKDKLKAEQAEEGSLVRMRQKLIELQQAYDKTGARTKAAATEIDNLSKEIKKAEAATDRHQRNVGNYADALGTIPGAAGGAIGGVTAFAKSLWGLMKIPIVAVISGIVLVLAGLFKAFSSTDEGAVAFAGAMKAVGNVVDVLIDRLWSFFKLIGSIATFDWEGMKKNSKETFGNLTKAIGETAAAGKKYETVMDSISDREAASFVRTEKLRKEYVELSIASKNRAVGTKEQIRLAELAVSKEKEANGIELGFLQERNKAEKDNLASKIRGDKDQFDKWLAITDLTLEKELEKNAAFKQFYNENEEEFKKLQKNRADEIGKESEANEKSRRMQTSLLGFKAELIEDEVKKTEAKNKSLNELEKEASDILEEMDLDRNRKKVQAIEDSFKKQQELIDNAVKYEEDIINEFAKDDDARLNQYLENEDKKLDKEKEVAEEKKEIAKQVRDMQIELATEAINGIFDLSSAKRDAELSALDKEREEKLSNDKLTAAQKDKINQEYDKKVAVIKTKQAKADKLQALFNIAIGTAMGVAYNLKTTPLIPWIIALGALQAGLVAAKPIPKFAKGTGFAPDKGIFGEAGRELMFLKSGEIAMANQATYFEGSKFKGAKIKSNAETEKIMSMTGHNSGGRQMTDERLINEMRGVKMAILNKPVSIIDKQNRTIGFGTSHHQTIYLNRLMRNN